MVAIGVGVAISLFRSAPARHGSFATGSAGSRGSSVAGGDREGDVGRKAGE
jgi:hypothetical protein